jgi:hypothetical protein
VEVPLAMEMEFVIYPLEFVFVNLAPEALIVLVFTNFGSQELFSSDHNSGSGYLALNNRTL